MRRKYILFFVLCMLYQIQAKVTRTVTVSLVEETINGLSFSHRIDSIDGAKKEQWVLNNKPVERELYERAVLEAELDERRNERQREYEKRIHLVEFKHEARKQTARRLLQKILEQLEQSLAKFEVHDIKPFLVYNTQSIADEAELATIINYSVPEARALLAGEFDIERALGIIDKLEPLDTKLALLFEDSVNNAINKCDEPQKLKKWLTMLS